MNTEAFRAQSSVVFWIVALVVAASPVVAYAIAAIRRTEVARTAAWLFVLVAVAGMAVLCNGQPAGFRMLALNGVLFYAMKGVVAVEARADSVVLLAPMRWLAFAILWPGMQPATFEKRAPAPLPGAGKTFVHGLVMAAGGIILVATARLLWLQRWHIGIAPLHLACTALLLAGVSLIIHFGLFNIATGCWRFAGFDCHPLFRTPLLSKSLAEFWAKRWNLAFSQMLTIAVYRPIVRRTGRPRAELMCFLYSGILHEIAISLPVMAGFGLPLAYFVLQGVLTLLERNGKMGRGRLGHAWVIACVVLPIPILFHPWFLRGVIWPIIGMR